MSRRLLAVGGPNHESEYLPQALTTNAFVEGEITRQKGGGRRRYEDDTVRPHRNCRGRNKQFYHSSRYANNSDSTAAETASNSEITITTNSSKGRQRQRRNRRSIRAHRDSQYKADDECNYKQRKNATDTKNCVRNSKELPLMANKTQAVRARPAGQSNNYMEQTVSYPATKNMPSKAAAVGETAGTTKEMLRFMDTLYRTLGNVQDEMAANNIAVTRETNATKAPQIGNTSITNQGERIVRDVPPNMSNCEQYYAHFGLQLPQQVVYQTHVTHAPTQNTCYPTCNKNSVYSQNAQAVQTSSKKREEYQQLPQFATNPTQPQRFPICVGTSAQASEKIQPSRCIPQRCVFPQYASTSQPTPSTVHSSMPQVYFPGPTRQQVVCNRPATVVPTQASIQTLPPGMYRSHVEEYVLSRSQQQPALQKQPPSPPITTEGRKQNHGFSLLRNSRQQSYRTSQPANHSNQYVTVNGEINTTHTEENAPVPQQHIYTKQPSDVANQNLASTTDSYPDTYNKAPTQFKGLRNSVQETVISRENVQAYNYSVINNNELTENNGNGAVHTDVENKTSGGRVNEEETERRNSKTLQDGANLENKESEQMRRNNESRKHSHQEDSHSSNKGEPVQDNHESKHKKKRESISDTNAGTDTAKRIHKKTASDFKKNSAEKELELGESKSAANLSNSCDSDYIRECLRRQREKNKDKRRHQRHRDSFSESDSEQTSNDYSEYSSKRDTRRKRYSKHTPTDSESNDDMQYSLSRTSCKELKKCCSRIVAICRMARDTAGTQTEQWDDGASLRPRRSNKLAECLPKNIADGLATANPRVVQQIMQLNRDRRCRVCACGMLNEAGAPVVKDDMIILKFDEHEPKLPTRMDMERRSRCACNCGCKLSDTESEIIREIIRKKRLQEKSKRISALTQNKYDACDCDSACDFVDEEDEREFIENLLRKQRRNRERERDRIQAQNINENYTSKAKELAAEIMHEMVKSHIQKIVTDELKNKARVQQEPENASVNSSATITSNVQVSAGSVKSKAPAGVCTCVASARPLAAPNDRKAKPQRIGCTCEADKNPTVVAKSKKTASQALGCTCNPDQSPTVTPKSKRTKPQRFGCTCESDDSRKCKAQCTCESDESRTPSICTCESSMFDCTCDATESRTVTQTFTKTIELQSVGATKGEMASKKRHSNSSSLQAKKQTKSAKKQSRNGKRNSKSAEDNEEEYITMMQESMAAERKSDASSKGTVRKNEQENRRSALEAQLERYSSKNAMDAQVNGSSSSGERLGISELDDKLTIKNSADKEFVPTNYYEDRMKAQRKITDRLYQTGPTKPTNDFSRCRDDCGCRVAHTPKIESVEEREYEPKSRAQPVPVRTNKAKKEFRICSADCACKEATEPVFNDLEEYALSNVRNMERSMMPEMNFNDEDDSLPADSGQGSIEKLIIDIKASKKAHASCTVTAYPKSNKNTERNTQTIFDREAHSSDADFRVQQRATLCAELTMNELLPQHSLRTLLTKLSSPDGKLYATDEFKAQPKESLRLAKMNQSKIMNMPATGKRKLSPTTVMAQSLRVTGNNRNTDPVTVPKKFISETPQLSPPNNTPSLAESRGFSAGESEFQQQHVAAHVKQRQDDLSKKSATKSRIPLPVNSNTFRAMKQTKSVSNSSSAETRANTRPLIDQTSDSNHQITRLWPEPAATATQLGAKGISNSQSNIEFSYGLNYSSPRPRLESGKHEELPKLSNQESQSSAVPLLKAESIRESFGNAKLENPHFKTVNILSAANQYPMSSSGPSSESCKTNDSGKQDQPCCARCRAFYKKACAHRNMNELQANTNGRLTYVPQARPSPTLIPATIHATSKPRHAERFSITDDDQTDSDIECITVEYGASEGDSYTQYQEELLRKQQLWRTGTVRKALEVEEQEERARNLLRTTLTGECLERAIHYPTRVWNEERKQLNLQRNGAGIFGPL